MNRIKKDSKNKSEEVGEEVLKVDLALGCFGRGLELQKLIVVRGLELQD